MQKLFNSQISPFSFFEYIGLLTCGTVLANYFLDKPLINIGVFSIYCLIGFFLSILKFYINYKKFKPQKRVENEQKS
ncbi:hypothetical protein F905_03004 [Acinetobacter sp. CIP 53.82]|nr:hypothetical protein F905_03004 [Acinetobacter sp. CIP 53.82]